MQSTVSSIQQKEFRTVVSGPFYKIELYNDDGSVILSQLVDKQQHLDNSIQELDCMPFQGGSSGMATKKISRAVTIDGVKRWIRADNEQEYADRLLELTGRTTQALAAGKHPFRDYALNWLNVYALPNVATATGVSYRQQLEKHLLPVFGEMFVEDITTDDVQQFFNGMNGRRTTKERARGVLNQVLESAVEDGIIAKSPLKSKRLRISGGASEVTATYSVEQMRYIVQHLDNIHNAQDRLYMALQALHPMRLEEVLGLQWQDVDLERGELHIIRAVSHPRRNRPEVKRPKTESSVRVIGLNPLACKYLEERGTDNDFLIGGSVPLSYTQVRRMCGRIQKDIGFSERITPKRFRTTVLTDVYAQTKDVKLTQQAAGHTTAAMTLKYYVQGRGSVAEAANAICTLYS